MTRQTKESTAMQTDSNPFTTYVGKHRGEPDVSGPERNLAKHEAHELRWACQWACPACSPRSYAKHHAKHKAAS